MTGPGHERLVIGYHGSDAAVAAEILNKKGGLKPSANPYDWLGKGIYFWEHGPRRAYEWAIEQASLSGGKVKNPSVLAAKINLGVCLDLLDTANTRLLREWYFEFRRFVREGGTRMPQNRDVAKSRRGDRVLRFLDCALIDYAVSSVAAVERIQFQTVRGVFLEGEPAFPGSKIALKSHIQIAVRDLACIVSLFQPDRAEYLKKG
jgi:hypothetical protein